MAIDGGGRVEFGGGVPLGAIANSVCSSARHPRGSCVRDRDRISAPSCWPVVVFASRRFMIFLRDLILIGAHKLYALGRC